MSRHGQRPTKTCGGKGGDWINPSNLNKYTPENALRLATVIACVRRRQSLISQIPFSAYRLDGDGFAVEVPRQPPLIASPSPHVTRSAWFAQMSVSRDLWGNAFGMISARDAGGYPTVIDWLDPSTVAVELDGPMSQKLRYKINGQHAQADDILMIPALVLPGSPIGVAPLAYSGLVELGRMSQAFASDWFKNGATPSSLLVVDSEITEEEAARLKESVVRSWRGRRPAVVGSGVSFKSAQSDSMSTSAAFIETMHQVQTEICQVFGVPIEALGVGAHGSSLTYANRETQVQSELVTGLNSDIVTIQEHLTDCLPRPQFVRANTGALLRSDLTTRYASYSTALMAGFLSVDEVRALEDLRPLPPTETLPAVEPGKVTP